MSHEALLPCPFCGRPVDDDLDDGCNDTLYPSGIYWREEHGMRHYVSHRERQEGDQPCWSMHCPTTGGGCDVEVTADSRAEVIAKWNRRAPDAAVREPHAALSEAPEPVALQIDGDAALRELLADPDPDYREIGERINAGLLAQQAPEPVAQEPACTRNGGHEMPDPGCLHCGWSPYESAGMDAARAKAIEECLQVAQDMLYGGPTAMIAAIRALKEAR
jgi:hypothetical protein